MASAHHPRQLSIESLDALVSALGLLSLHTPSRGCEGTGEISRKPLWTLRDPPLLSDTKCAVSCPPTEAIEFEDVIMLHREVISFFDISPNMDDNDVKVYDTLPSRPGSSLDCYEVHCNLNAFYPPTSLADHVLPTRSTSLVHKIRKNHIDVKAAHNATIIMLRVPRDIGFADLKQRLYDKFVKQENSLLSRSFSIVLALPPQPNPAGPRRHYRRVSLANCTEMRFIDRDAEWREVTAMNDGRKITLRILDTQA